MSNTRDTGFLRNAIQVTDQGVTFVSGSTTLMSISSSGAVTTTGVISGSNALSASYSISGSYAVSSSYAFTASSAVSASYILNAVSSSYAYTASSAINAFSASKAMSSSYADTASFANNFTVLGNLTVFGTQSVQYITSSQLNVSDNVITVNVASPGVRFGGLSVFDSGSLSSEATASLFWDSQNNHWIYQRESSSIYNGGMLISGPRNFAGLGNEEGTTNNSLMKGQGGDHITSSAIFEVSGSVTMGNAITNRHAITGSLNLSGSSHSILGSLNLNTTSSITNVILNIQSVSNSAGLIINNSNPSAYTGFRVYNDQVSANRALEIDYAGSTYSGALVSNGIAGESAVIVTTGAYPLQFGTNNAFRMCILSGGNVGIGTTSPEALMHLNKATSGGEGAFIFLDNSAGSTLGNKAGIRFATNAGATFSTYGSYIEAINVDAGNGAESLTFGTWNGASRDERMRIHANGNISIGNPTNTGDLLYLAGNLKMITNGKIDSNGGYLAINSATGGNVLIGTTTDYGGKIQSRHDGNGAGSTYSGVHIMNSSSAIGAGVAARLSFNADGGSYQYGIIEQRRDGGDTFWIKTQGSGNGNIYVQANTNGVYVAKDSTSWTSNSDERLKNIVGNIENAVESLNTLRTVKHTWKSDKTNKEYYALIAQDVEKVLPNVIDKSKLGNGDDTEYLGVRYTELVPVLVKAIKELKLENDSLKEILQRNNIN